MNHDLEIREFLVTSFAPDLAASAIAGDLDLLEAGVIDSLGLLTLIGWIEDHFGVVVEDDDLSPERFSSVDAIRTFVETARRAESTGTH